MKLLVDRMPEHRYCCPFFRIVFNDKGAVVDNCKLDNKPCNLIEPSKVQNNSCRWLKEHEKD
jgi:hypothetical protein